MFINSRDEKVPIYGGGKEQNENAPRGTHSRTTGETDAIKLKPQNVGKGKERVEIYLQR